jgi:hypothetical protein
MWALTIYEEDPEPRIYYLQSASRSMNKDSKSTRLDNTDIVPDIRYENRVTRPLEFGELCLILTRFQIMLEEEPNRYTVEEFIQQEDFRRGMFS